MQQTTTRLYEFTDLGSPVLNGTNGSFIALLKTILVGTAGVAYGGKPSLGWTVVWEEGSSIVFRNNTTLGNGAYLKVTDNTSYAQVWAWESMSDINTGTNPVNAIATYVYKSNATNSNARPWFLVGDERTFYFYNNAADTRKIQDHNNNVLAFGDFIRFDGKPGVFISGSRTSNSSSNTIGTIRGNDGSSTWTQSFSCSRNNAGEPEATYCTTAFGVSTASCTAGQLMNQYPSGAAFGGAGKCVNSAITLWSRLPILNSTSTPSFILGYMRGMWCPITAVNDLNKLVGFKEKPAYTNAFNELLVIGTTPTIGAITLGWFGVETQRSWDTV